MPKTCADCAGTYECFIDYVSNFVDGVCAAVEKDALAFVNTLGEPKAAAKSGTEEESGESSCDEDCEAAKMTEMVAELMGKLGTVLYNGNQGAGFVKGSLETLAAGVEDADGIMAAIGTLTGLPGLSLGCLVGLPGKIIAAMGTREISEAPTEDEVTKLMADIVTALGNVAINAAAVASCSADAKTTMGKLKDGVLVLVENVLPALIYAMSFGQLGEECDAACATALDFSPVTTMITDLESLKTATGEADCKIQDAFAECSDYAVCFSSDALAQMLSFSAEEMVQIATELGATDLFNDAGEVDLEKWDALSADDIKKLVTAEIITADQEKMIAAFKETKVADDAAVASPAGIAATGAALITALAMLL